MKSPRHLQKLSKLKAPIMVRRISGHSMVPTLPPGTYVVAFRWLRKPKVDSVIIFEHEGKEKIKRLQAVRDDEMYVVGDHIETSTDSRHFGWLPVTYWRARVVWPHVGKKNDDYSG